MTANVLRKCSVELINLMFRSHKSLAAAMFCVALIATDLVILHSGHQAKTGELNIAPVQQNQSSTSPASIPFSESAQRLPPIIRATGLASLLPQRERDCEPISRNYPLSSPAQGCRLIPPLPKAVVFIWLQLRYPPFGQRPLGPTGTVAVGEKIVTYARPGLTEE